MLDYIRVALFTLLIICGFLLYQAWDKDHPKPVLQNVLPTESVPTDRYIPDAVNTVQTATQSTAITQPAAMPVIAPPAQGQIVHVKTDVLDVNIDTRGGDIVQANLLKYPQALNSTTPFTLFNDDKASRYLAESGLISQAGPDTSKEQGLYTVPQTEYTLADGQKDLVVNLTWQKNGINVTKSFIFTRDSYEIKVAYEINNQATSPWTGSLYTQLTRTNTPPPSNGGIVNLATYFGAAISTPDKRFEKVTFKDMAGKELHLTAKDGWAAMIQHYFIGAWVPPQNATSLYYSKATNTGLYTIGMVGNPLTVAPGQKVVTQAKLYAGPASADRLEQAAPSLKLTIDYGWFWFISALIFWMMQKIYDVVGNWGWSIVLVTIVIKLLFYQLSAKSYRSMSGLKRLQPKIEALKQRYGDDKQKLTQATIELYKQEKVNPMSGCLPLLIQIPVFIALYWVLVESVELRQAPFILWIKDLSQHDPYYVLPILMGLSMFIQQRLNPPPPDPMQAKVMMAMPVVFTVLFANFPAGLMLYWFVNNTLSFLQQWYIMRTTNNAPKAVKAKH